MKVKLHIVFCAIAFSGCRKPYNPPAVTATTGYLVVEGVIDPGADSTTIKLSRTVNISSNITVNPVTGAIVNVVSDQNASVPLTEASSGSYVSPGLNLDVTHQYQLSIKTSDGKQYRSDLEPVVVTPLIDSIGFNITTVPDTGIQIYANAHDPTNTIKYYRWDYDENWEFHSLFVSNYISNGSMLVQRGPSQYVSTCYLSDVSSDIVLGSTAKLSRATLYQSPLAFISSKSEKIEARYRIVLRQYALTSDAYVFWQNLKKNTEQLGNIFDAEPSETPGNIHCITNPAEPVVGFVSVCTIATKTREIDERVLPAWVPDYPYKCTLDTAKLGLPNYQNLVQFPQFYLATDPIGSSLNPSGYLWTSRECADCSIRGSLTPPTFWR